MGVLCVIETPKANGLDFIFVTTPFVIYTCYSQFSTSYTAHMDLVDTKGLGTHETHRQPPSCSPTRPSRPKARGFDPL